MQYISVRKLAHPLRHRIAFCFPHTLSRNLNKQQKSARRHSFSISGPVHRQRKPALLRASASNPASVEMTTNPSEEGCPLSNPEQSRLYFCYGSNMLREKLKNRGLPMIQPITFTQVWKARLPDWQLCFDLAGAPPQEPAMASIRKHRGDEVYGLIYRIASEDCWKALLRSEGITEHQGAHNSYHVVTVEVECFEEEKPSETKKVLVQTLMTNPKFCLSNNLQTLVRPSQRYMNLLIQGAKQEQLPPAYIQRLEAVPVARRWGPSILLTLMIITVPLTFLARRRSIRFLAYPLSTLGMFLYAMHEKFAIHSKETSFSRNVGLWLCRASMLIFYGLYTVPACLCLVLSAKGRQIFKIFVLGKVQKKQHDRPAQTTSS